MRENGLGKEYKEYIMVKIKPSIMTGYAQAYPSILSNILLKM